MKRSFSQLTIPELLFRFRTDSERGLSSREATLRLQRIGYNEIPEPKSKSTFYIFLSQFQNPLIYILLLAALLIFLVGQNHLDACIIGVVLMFNALIGTIQERRTESILSALKQFMVTTCLVVRNGNRIVISTKDLVPGDLIIVQEGERVPADIRLIASAGIQVNEAILTGESESVDKYIVTYDQAPILSGQANMLFKGTYLLTGSGLGIVVATGLQTEIGAIHKNIHDFQTEMPLKKELHALSYWILLFVLIVCIVLFVIGFIFDKPMHEMLVMLTALFICVVPEGLPVVLTLVLVSGVYKMARHKVLIKHMHAVEGLGRTNVIIVDKTGTLTRNELVVTDVYVHGKILHVTGQGYRSEGDIVDNNMPVILSEYPYIQEIARAQIILNRSQINYQVKTDQFQVTGDPTEAALAVFGKKVLPDYTGDDYELIYEIPFHSDYKYHAGLYKTSDGCQMYMVGSPEVIMQHAQAISADDERALADLLQKGVRVIGISTQLYAGVAQWEANFEGNIPEMLTDMQFLGFCGLQDSIRTEVPEAVMNARAAGLRIVMATGDHQKTACYVAEKVGILQVGDRVMTGQELDSYTNEQLLPILEQITVFARVDPEHKLRIVQLYHNTDEIVAMTGDGVNDGPSLAAADVGIAMGNSGTEVARQASDIILLDDSFAHIVTAIEHGRHIFYALKRVVLYFFATNMGEIFIIFFALCLNVPLPITAAQILWLNLVTDGFLDIALAMEPQEKSLLVQRGWLSKENRKLIDWNLIGKMIYMALAMGIGSIIVFYHYYSSDLLYARTMTVLTMAMFQWFNAWNCRSHTKSLFQIGFFKNRWLMVTTLFVLFLQILLVYTSLLQHIFKTVSISYQSWITVISISSSILFLEEIRKLIVRRWFSDSI